MPIPVVAVDRLLRVWAERTLHRDPVLERVVVEFRGDDRGGSGAVLDPVHHGEEDVVLGVYVPWDGKAVTAGGGDDLAGCCYVVGRYL